jgi:hypothetical protein
MAHCMECGSSRLEWKGDVKAPSSIGYYCAECLCGPIRVVFLGPDPNREDMDDG